MTTLEPKPAPNPVEQHLLAPSFDGDWPEWFLDSQRSAWEEYQHLPSPKRTDEAWRFANIRALTLDGFRVAEECADAESLVSQSRIFDDVAARFIFANNRPVHRSGDPLPAGVVVKPLVEAAREHADLIREFFMSQPVELGSGKFAALHRAMVSGGTLVHIPEGVEIDRPIELFHYVSGEGAAVFPHTLVICSPRSRATVIDVFRSVDGARAFACGMNDLHLAEGARLDYTAIQDWSPQSLAFHVNSTIVGKDACATALSVNFGSKFLRGEALSRLVGEGARSVMLSINPVSGEREIDQRTLQDHVAPRATSDLLYHNVLEDRARTIFAGLIKVCEGAHETDAYQKVRNLLLSDEAEANSMPGLEILADNVKCSHGATSGEINEDELFYMQARGISPDVARRMIVAGFFHSLLDRVDHAALRTTISRIVSNRLGIPS